METLDRTAPTAAVTGGRVTGRTVSWTWRGTEVALQTHTSGLRSFDVEYRVNSGAWRLLKSRTTATALTSRAGRPATPTPSGFGLATAAATSRRSRLPGRSGCGDRPRINRPPAVPRVSGATSARRLSSRLVPATDDLVLDQARPDPDVLGRCVDAADQRLGLGRRHHMSTSGGLSRVVVCVVPTERRPHTQVRVHVPLLPPDDS